jgi:hypothetical protein
MTDFLNKISSYNLFNYLFSGILFVILSSSVTFYSFAQEDLLFGLFLYYFIGLVISRLGSLIIQPIFQALSFVKFEKYSDYIAACRKDSLIETLSEANNMYRTLCSVFGAALLLKAYEILSFRYMWVMNIQVYLLATFLLVLFAFAYRKQTDYISKRIRANLN